MSTTKRSIFRERAIQHYARSREKDVLPRYISPPVFLFLWIMLGLSLVIGWLSWTIHVPTTLSGVGTVVAGQPSTGVQVVLFFPADHQRALRAGERVLLQIGSASTQWKSTIASVATNLGSPLDLRQQYHLDGTLSLLVAAPSVVVMVGLDSSFPASSYAGSIVHAQVQVGEHSLLSVLLP